MGIVHKTVSSHTKLWLATGKMARTEIIGILRQAKI